VDAIIDRIDLVALAREVIVAIDLPEIIRESTGSVASETLRGVRMQSISGDDAIARVVERVRLHRARGGAAPRTV
jgi:predicted RNase H-like nuclease